MEFAKGLQVSKAIFIYYMEISVIFIYLVTEKLFRLFVQRPLKSLAGEIILITGTGNGIGKQLALQLADLEPTAKFVCWDVETHANDETVAELRKKNVTVYGYTVDVSDREQIFRTADLVRSEVGDVTILINNAGIAPAGPFLTQKPEILEKLLKINTMASFWTCQTFLPDMIRKNHGHVVTMASISAYLPIRDLAVYSCSKAGVNGFLEALKTEIRFIPTKPYNIHFTTVYPIIVATRLFEAVVLEPRFEGMVPVISPEYVAQKTIEGFRRNYEYLYLPPIAQILAICRTLFPMEIIRKIEEDILTCDIKHLHVNNNTNTNNGSSNSAISASK